MTLTMDGRRIEFEGRPTLLELARANGVHVPSLCDHPALAPFGACRLCLVEVEGRNRPVPSCHVAAEDGMVVVTAGPKLEALRRGILELILSEHPHACVICAEKSSCDEFKSTIRKTGEVTGCVLCPVNGRCELQKAAQAVGLDVVDFASRRRDGEVRRDDPFIDRDNALCILCGRCVRVCAEVRGAEVLTYVSRGASTVIGTALDRRLVDSGCQFCGACVDVCPTGSLAERAVRYDPLPDAVKKAVCTLCGQGCRLKVDLRQGRVAGATPDPDGPANRGQACVRGRFLVKFAQSHPRRLLRPLLRENGALREASWDEALTLAADRLAGFGPGGVAVSASAQGSCEDLFVLHKLAEAVKGRPVEGTWEASAAAAMRALGSAAGRTVPLNFRLSDIDKAAAIVVVGEDLPADQPIVGVHVHKASANGAAVTFVPAGAGLAGLGSLAGAGKPALFLFGPDLANGEAGLAPLAALWDLAATSGGRVIALDREANVRGGLEVAAAFAAKGPKAPVRSLYLAGASHGPGPLKAEFVIVQASFADDRLDVADIVLPEATSFEAEGTFVNVEGRIQVTAPVTDSPGEAKPGWWIASALASKLGAAGAAFETAAAVRAAIAAAIPAFAGLETAGPSDTGLFLAEAPTEGFAPVGKGVLKRLGPRPRRLVRPADVYKGLDLAAANKSLRLVRERR